MSRKGIGWDNACSETLFGSLKMGRLYEQRFKSRDQAKDETLAGCSGKTASGGIRRWHQPHAVRTESWLDNESGQASS
jgi:hypothetical protein